MAEDNMRPGKRLIEALKASGCEIREVRIIPTPESIRRRKEVLEFLAKLKRFEEASRNSSLHFGAMM